MGDEEAGIPAPYPNKLREFREADGLTRAGLKSLCDDLSLVEPARYRAVGLTTLRDLELGLSRPKMRTAATVANALKQSITELFPLGIEDPLKNPSGNTRITTGRQTGGRKQKL